MWRSVPESCSNLHQEGYIVKALDSKFRNSRTTERKREKKVPLWKASGLVRYLWCWFSALPDTKPCSWNSSIWLSSLVHCSVISSPITLSGSQQTLYTVVYSRKQGIYTKSYIIARPSPYNHVLPILLFPPAGVLTLYCRAVSVTRVKTPSAQNIPISAPSIFWVMPQYRQCTNRGIIFPTSIS